MNKFVCKNAYVENMYTDMKNNVNIWTTAKNVDQPAILMGGLSRKNVNWINLKEIYLLLLRFCFNWGIQGPPNGHP